MEEQLISFDTAKLAKEKNLNILVNAFYDWEDAGDERTEADHSEVCFSSTSEDFNVYPYSCSAPTQSLLAKWLRDVHHKDIIIIPEYYTTGINWNWQILWHDLSQHDCKNGTGLYGDNAEYPTYELALEAAILHCLKYCL